MIKKIVICLVGCDVLYAGKSANFFEEYGASKLACVSGSENEGSSLFYKKHVNTFLDKA